MSELTTERLEKRIKNCIEVGNGCVMLPVSVAEELLAYRKTVNHLLDNDGSRGKFSAVQSYDAREDLEQLLASTVQQNEPQNIPENIPAQPVIPEHSGDNLPCPFCGGEVDVSGWRSSNGNSGPECNECGATASNLSDWNKRTAQHVSEPYKLPELNDELVEILGRPNFTCTKLAECLRHCGQDIKRKSEYEQAAVLHVLLNLYIKHGNDWRKHAEEAFTPAPARESE